VSPSERIFVARLSALVLVLLGTACEIEKVAINPPPTMFALHGMLSATASTQVVLLEHTRNGTIEFVGPPIDLPDPTVSDDGVAESDALVTLQSPTGELYVAREDYTVRSDGKGRGIYRFSLPGSALERNASYRLAVRTFQGALLSAETSVPGGVATEDELGPPATDVLFDRSRDTLDLRWPASVGARSYFVRIETPLGPRSFFTESTHVRLPGELRNANVTSLPHVFIPGFPQTITVSAVDSNYYDWYRTKNDAIAAEGLVSRVQGGIGVLGSLVRLRLERVHVVAPQSQPVAGEFVFDGTQFERSVTPFLSLTLYLESPSARADQPDLLSGRYEVRSGWKFTGCQVCGLFGTARDGAIKLALLEVGIDTKGWSGRDTTELFTGELKGDTITGSYSGLGGRVRFVKRR
jgi:hypothetical protein